MAQSYKESHHEHPFQTSNLEQLGWQPNLLPREIIEIHSEDEIAQLVARAEQGLGGVPLAQGMHDLV